MQVLNKRIDTSLIICIFLIFSYQNFTLAQSRSKELIEAEKMMDEINNTKPTKRNQSQREASIEAAKLESERMMNSAKKDEKFDYAINIFSGFYLINAISRPSYCQKYGVSINKFTDLFKSKYKNEFNVMSEYDRTHKLSEKDKAEMFQMFAKQVATEIEMTAKQNNVTNEFICKDFQKNAIFHVNSLDLKTRAPEIYYILNK